jgi:hypothetical protein
MAELPNYPFLTQNEFLEVCQAFVSACLQKGHEKNDWSSIKLFPNVPEPDDSIGRGLALLRITKHLPSEPLNVEVAKGDSDEPEGLIEEEDKV